MYGVLNLNLLVLAFGSAFEKGVTPVLYNHILKQLHLFLLLYYHHSKWICLGQESLLEP